MTGARVDPDGAVNDGSPIDLLRPGRTIRGFSAVLLPYTDRGEIDIAGFASLLERTVLAGLTPAVNMDTGYVNLLSPDERANVLNIARGVVGDRTLVAGAFIDDAAGAAWNPDAMAAALDAVAQRGAVPVIFPSHGMASLSADELVEAHRWIGERCDRFIAFELGEMFSKAGRIWDIETWAAIAAIPSCIGAKHSSLRRDLEWERLRRRDRDRPGFHVFTGNDLAIDMVMYGSDYLLGLSAFAPDLFAARDRAWASGDASFYERNDDLQALGAFAFREPVPAYKHTAAQFLRRRGWIGSDTPHPRGSRRPDTDSEVLRSLLARLERWA